MRGMMRLAIMGVPGAQGGAAAFSPDTIEGLQLWLDASDTTTLYQDSAGTTPATADADPVGLWKDKSGNALDVAQASADSRPLLKLNQVNGRPVIRLDGTDDHLTRTTLDALNVANNYSVFIVFKSGEAKVAKLWAQATAGTNRHAMNLSATNLIMIVNTGTPYAVSTLFSDTTAAHVASMLYTSLNNLVGYLDGMRMVGGIYDGANIGPGFWLGRDVAGIGPYKGDYCEILIYNNVVSDVNRIAIERYLATKWGITYHGWKAYYNWRAATLADMEYVGKYEGTNPVIPCGGVADTDRYIREIGTMLYEPTDTGKEYKIWYTGYNAGRNTDEKIHHAYSSDGHTWTKSASNPVISDRSEDPYVVKNGDTYYLYLEDKAGGAVDIKRFTSADGVTWENGTIVLEPGEDAWEDRDVSSPVVWIEDGVWYLLYEGRGVDGSNGIGLATSEDGLTWVREASNPVFTAADTGWVIGHVVPDDIIKTGGTYYMTYHGESPVGWAAGIAYSTTLTTWTDQPNGPFEMADMWTRPETLMLCEGSRLILMGSAAGTDALGIFRGYPVKR